MTDQDNQKLTALIKAHEPSAKNIEFVEHGYQNIVAVVDRKLVFRFPRHKKAEYWLISEALILQELGGKLPKTPKTLHLNRSPLYSVQNFIPGKHLTEEDLASLPIEKHRQIAADLVQFTVDYSRLLPNQTLKDIQKQASIEASETVESWPVYLERMLVKSSYPDYPEIEKLAKQYFQKWLEATTNDKLPTKSLHDDLHLHNILFKEGQISGILDFGDSAIGTANEEMRNFFPFGQNFLEIAASKYAELTGEQVDIETIKIWAITTNLASMCKRLSADMTDSSGFIRAKKNL